MTLFSVDQIVQYSNWLFALLEVIMALYMLVLSARNIANRSASLLLLIMAVNSFAVGAMLQAANVAQATWPSYLIAITSPLSQWSIILTSFVLLNPSWLRERGGWFWKVLLGILLAPILLVVVDVNFGTQLWYTGLEASYAGGYTALSEYTAGILSPVIRAIYFYLGFLILPIYLFYFAIKEQEASPEKRNLAKWLGGAVLFALIVQRGLQGVLVAPLRVLIAQVGFAFVYVRAIFRQIILGNYVKQWNVRGRLTAVVMVIAIPVFIAMTLLFISQFQQEIENQALERLQITSETVANSTEIWLSLNFDILRQLVKQPSIVRMDPAEQAETLKVLQNAHPQFYLVSVTDLEGINVARSDGAALKDYSDRYWFQSALDVPDASQPVLQTLISRTSGEPSLAASLPIQDTTGQTIGVGMFASDLDRVTQEVAVASWGDTGIAYVVDTDNRVVAHPDPSFSTELRDLSATAPLVALRSGQAGWISFTEDGTRWRAYLTELANGWGVVVQQQEAEILLPVQRFRRIAGVGMVTIILLLVGLFTFAIYQEFVSFTKLTEAATAITHGDLTYIVKIESEDEFGVLANAFNEMTGRLRELVTSLERRVTARTRELEQRTRYLEAAARVARDATSVLEPEELLSEAVKLISERFGFYHTGIFLLDGNKEWAQLRAASSAGGQKMLAREHRLKVGEVGIVGYVTQFGEPRVVSDVGKDAVFFDNPDLPETCSEMALPLLARGEIIGALDVQSKRSAAFSDEEVTVLQTLTDQLAVAIENTRLLRRLEESLTAERIAYGELSQLGWQKIFQRYSALQYACDASGVHSLVTEPSALDAGLPTEEVQLIVRDKVIGTLQARKPEGVEWTAAERELLKSLSSQLDLALESARLYEDSRLRAARERVIGEAAARMRETLDVEGVLRTAASEFRKALAADSTEVWLEIDTE